MGLTLLAHASIPLKFWDEAFLTAIFLINRLISKTLSDQSPFERLYGKSPDYTFLCTFGCAVWPNLRPFNSTKLQFRSKKCVFLGYSHVHKGFECLDPAEGRIYISWDVGFDEHIFPFASLHPNAGARLRGEIALLHPSLLSPNASFGDAFFRDQYTSPPVTTNILPSTVDLTKNAGDKSVINDAVSPSPGQYFLCLHSGARHGSDSPAPRTGGSALDHAPSLSSYRMQATVLPGPTTLEPPAPTGSSTPTQEDVSTTHVPIQPQSDPASLTPDPVPATTTTPTEVVGTEILPAGFSTPVNPASSSPQRHTTRLQQGIIKPKTYIDGTV